jgi:hypothetical protein
MFLLAKSDESQDYQNQKSLSVVHSPFSLLGKLLRPHDVAEKDESSEGSDEKPPRTGKLKTTVHNFKVCEILLYKFHELQSPRRLNPPPEGAEEKMPSIPPKSKNPFRGSFFG